MNQQRATRSNYFIQKGLQVKFTFILVMIVMLVATITLFNLYIIGDYVIQNTNTLIELRDMRSFIMTVFTIVGWRIVILGVVCVLILAIIGIFYSHQFAGPSYKLEKCLKEISEGNLSFSIRLRNGDALHNVADSVNYLVDQFRVVIAKTRDIGDNVKLQASQLKSKADSEELQEILDRVSELEELLAGFQLTREEAQLAQQTVGVESPEEEPESKESSV